MKEESIIISAYDKKTLENCTFCKTVLMFLIVLYHSMIFWKGEWFTANPIRQSKILSDITLWLGNFHIYAFVLISGYIYCAKYKIEDKTDFLPFIKKKAKRLLVPYIFTALVWVVPITNFFLPFRQNDIFTRYILAENPSQLWFLIMLFDVFLFVRPLSDFFIKHTILGGGAALVFYILGIGGGYFLPNIFGVWNGMQYILFFFLGFKLCQKGSSQLQRIPCFAWFLADLVLFAAWKWAEDKNGVIFLFFRQGTGLLLHIVGALMAFIILQKLGSNVKWKQNKIFVTFSKYSMPIYLFHQQIIYFLIDWLNGAIHPYVHTSVNFIGAILISSGISAVLMKWKAMRFLIGEK